ncbi:MAG TPA: YbaB/EbfC family nucleoid-associated protein [Rectinemataceae bacterium]
MDLSDLLGMLKNPQAIQAKAEELRRRTAAIRATGMAGGGLVKITLTGEMELVECSIAPEILEPSEASMLGDLVRAAHNDAAAKIQEALRQSLAEDMGSMGLPAGFGGLDPFGRA